MSLANIRRMYGDPAALDAEIARTEAVITAKGKFTADRILYDAQQLARVMVGRMPDPANHALKRNAYAIATLNQARFPRSVETIDRLVTLLAIRELDPKLRERLGVLAKSESRGFDFLLFYTASLRENEKQKLDAAVDKAQDADPNSVGNVVRLNAWKGHIPSEAPSGARLQVADASAHNGLLAQGYTRVGDYKGSGLETGRKGYYLSFVSGKATYNQGAMQTVHDSVFGIDPLSGLSTHGLTAGRIDRKDDAKLIRLAEAVTHMGQAGPGAREVLLPVYNEHGQIRTFERMLDPAMRDQLRPNTHFGEMLGAWAGRQHEEREAGGINELLVEALGKRWAEDHQAGRDDLYVNPADPLAIDDDPVLQDIWSMVPRAARVHAATVFGQQGVFMVRRDMMHNALGYRMPSPA